MIVGDRCWLFGLANTPRLNGRPVLLEEWVEQKKRWTCLADGWGETRLRVLEKNLKNEPPRVDYVVSSDEDDWEKSFASEEEKHEQGLVRSYWELAADVAPSRSEVRSCFKYDPQMYNDYTDIVHSTVEAMFARQYEPDNLLMLAKLTEKACNDLNGLNGLRRLRLVFYISIQYMGVAGDMAGCSEREIKMAVNYAKMAMNDAFDGKCGWRK